MQPPRIPLSIYIFAGIGLALGSSWYMHNRIGPALEEGNVMADHTHTHILLRMYKEIC